MIHALLNTLRLTMGQQQRGMLHLCSSPISDINDTVALVIAKAFCPSKELVSAAPHRRRRRAPPNRTRKQSLTYPPATTTTSCSGTTTATTTHTLHISAPPFTHLRNLLPRQPSPLHDTNATSDSFIESPNRQVKAAPREEKLGVDNHSLKTKGRYVEQAAKGGSKRLRTLAIALVVTSIPCPEQCN